MEQNLLACVLYCMEHINYERTIDEFGYSPDEKKPFDTCKVIRICSICGIEEIRALRAITYHKQTKCLTCSNKINAQKNIAVRNAKIRANWEKYGHSRLGKTHSEATRKRLSEVNRGKIVSRKTRLKLSISNSGVKNGFFGKKHDSETRKRMSDLAKIRAKRGPECNLYGRCFYTNFVKYTTPTGETIKLKSSWEAKIAKYLDDKGVKWTYEKTAFPVSFVLEGVIKNGSYCPDFFLENGEIWEVKGYWRGDAKIKFNAFLKAYPNLKVTVLEKPQLIEMGLL